MAGGGGGGGWGRWHFPISSRFYKSLYFCSTKSIDSLISKPHKSFQNKNNRKATYSFAPRPLIFKLQQQVWKSNDICVSWSSPKTYPETHSQDWDNFWRLKALWKRWKMLFISAQKLFSFSRYLSFCLDFLVV